MCKLRWAAMATLLSLACACGDKAEDVDDFDSTDSTDGADGADGSNGADGGGDDAPDVRSSRDAIDFGSVDVGNLAARTVLLFNDGGQELRVYGIFLSDAAPDLEIGAPTASWVPPGGSVRFEVVYTPTTPSTLAVALEVETNDPDESRLVVPVSGEALGPVIAVSPLEHDFGTLALG